jgi:hypothetical protein
VYVDVPRSAHGAVVLRLHHVEMHDLGRDGLHVDDGGGSSAGVFVIVDASSLSRAGTAGDSAGIRIFEAGDGGIAAHVVESDVIESADYGLRIDETGAGEVHLRTHAAAFNGNGGGDLDNDGGVSLLETGVGDVHGTFSDTVFEDNAGDGLEFFEEDFGDLFLSASRVQSLNNGLGITGNIEGFEIDESEEGTLDATLSDVTVQGNYFGIEFYEGGIDDDDPGDLRVHLTRVSTLENRSYGLYIDELRGGALDVQASGLRVDRNGEGGENGAYLLEGGYGDLRLSLEDASFTANGVDGLWIEESGAGDLDALLRTATVEDNGEHGIEAEQIMPGVGVLALTEVSMSGNGAGALELVGVTSR